MNRNHSQQYTLEVVGPRARSFINSFDYPIESSAPVLEVMLLNIEVRLFHGPGGETASFEFNRCHVYMKKVHHYRLQLLVSALDPREYQTRQGTMEEVGFP